METVTTQAPPIIQSTSPMVGNYSTFGQSLPFLFEVDHTTETLPESDVPNILASISQPSASKKTEYDTFLHDQFQYTRMPKLFMY